MATVWECGHAGCLMDVEHVKDHPQIHFHFLSSNEDFQKYKYGRLELCCHGCGASLLVYYTLKTPETLKQYVKVLFIELHQNCPNRDYENDCPNYRDHFLVLDLRLNSFRWISTHSFNQKLKQGIKGNKRIPSTT